MERRAKRDTLVLLGGGGCQGEPLQSARAPVRHLGCCEDPGLRGSLAQGGQVENADLAAAGLDPAQRTHRAERPDDGLQGRAAPAGELLLREPYLDPDAAVVLAAEALGELEQ